MTGSFRMWLCVVQFSNSQRNPRAANRGRSFHPDSLDAVSMATESAFLESVTPANPGGHGAARRRAAGRGSIRNESRAAGSRDHRASTRAGYQQGPGELVTHRQPRSSRRNAEKYASVDLPRRLERMEERTAFGQQRAGEERGGRAFLATARRHSRAAFCSEMQVSSSCLRKFDVICWPSSCWWPPACASGRRGMTSSAGAREFPRDRRVVSRAAGREPGPQLSASRHRRSLRRAQRAIRGGGAAARYRHRDDGVRDAGPRCLRTAYIEQRRGTRAGDRRRARGRRGVGAGDDRVRSPRRPHRRRCWPLFCPGTFSIARSSASSITTRSKCCCRSRRWRASRTARRPAPASASGCICWRGRAARISSSSSRSGSSLTAMLAPAQPRVRRPLHRDHGRHRAGDRARCSRIPRSSATTRRSPRWPGCCCCRSR